MYSAAIKNNANINFSVKRTEKKKKKRLRPVSSWTVCGNKDKK